MMRDVHGVGLGELAVFCRGGGTTTRTEHNTNCSPRPSEKTLGFQAD